MRDVATGHFIQGYKHMSFDSVMDRIAEYYPLRTAMFKDSKTRYACLAAVLMERKSNAIMLADMEVHALVLLHLLHRLREANVSVQALLDARCNASYAKYDAGICAHIISADDPVFEAVKEVLLRRWRADRVVFDASVSPGSAVAAACQVANLCRRYRTVEFPAGSGELHKHKAAKSAGELVVCGALLASPASWYARLHDWMCMTATENDGGGWAANVVGHCFPTGVQLDMLEFLHERGANLSRFPLYRGMTDSAQPGFLKRARKVLGSTNMVIGLARAAIKHGTPHSLETARLNSAAVQVAARRFDSDRIAFYYAALWVDSAPHFARKILTLAYVDFTLPVAPDRLSLCNAYVRARLDLGNLSVYVHPELQVVEVKHMVAWPPGPLAADLAVNSGFPVEVFAWAGIGLRRAWVAAAVVTARRCGPRRPHGTGVKRPRVQVQQADGDAL